LGGARSLEFVPRYARPGPTNLQHDHLRSALEFAVRTSAAWQKCKPPLAVPADIKPFVKQSRLPATVLGRVRRIVDADDEFRTRLADAATPGLVDEVGIEWLRRDVGWEDRVSDLVERHDQAVAERDAERQLVQEQRRRVAAEVAAIRTRAELVAVTDRLAEREADLEGLRRRESTAASEMEAARRSITELRQAARHARDRVEAVRRTLERAVSERDEALRRATAAESQRDELLATRAELDGGSPSGPQITRLRELSEAARSLSDRLTALVATGPLRRQPIEVPRDAAKDQRRTAEFLLKVPGILVLVDGYNVAKLAWPDLSLEQQRHNMLDGVDGLARRFGTEFAVILDGADVIGAHAARRRLARVRYSPAGTTADDVIREEIAGLDLRRSVAVVTNDGEVRRDVIAAGANIITSDALVALALR
jgi:YacP-like NYN domain